MHVRVLDRPEIPAKSAKSTQKSGATATMKTSGRVIVVALDHTIASANALTHVLDNVVRNGDKLVLVSVGVTEGPDWGDLVDAAADIPDPDLKEAESQASSILIEAEKQVKERFAGNEISIIRRAVTGSSVHDAIVDICNQVNANLLVLGSKNRPGFKRLILGSVSDECAHRAQCAVLIVKGPPEEASGKWPTWARL
ncbi:hypothetical protein DFS34DRAFT_647911 [Phlyctochytrium arcticum]|nr:hypothetical protein DFS34DRAFT_647911 [Phlyctochytrium arcticum]